MRTSMNTNLKKFLLLIFRFLLLGGGVAAVVALILHAGPAQVWGILVISAPWLPLIIFLEAAVVSWDIWVIRSLYGPAAKQVPWPMYFRSALIAYPFLGLLPAGRAGAEAARAATLSPWIGTGKASAAAFQAQACGLAGNFLISVIGVILCSVIFGFSHWIAYLLAINGIAALSLSVLIFLGIRGRFGGFLGKRFKSLGTGFDQHIRHSRVFPLKAILFSLLGRLTQFFHYIVFVIAVGGMFTLVGAGVGQSLHTIGAFVGDLIPSQLGATDGIYWQAAESVEAKQAEEIFGFTGGSDIILAAFVGIALLGRLAQLSWSLVGAITPLFWKLPEEESEPEDP